MKKASARNPPSSNEPPTMGLKPLTLKVDRGSSMYALSIWLGGTRICSFVGQESGGLPGAGKSYFQPRPLAGLLMCSFPVVQFRHRRSGFLDWANRSGRGSRL